MAVRGLRGTVYCSRCHAETTWGNWAVRRSTLTETRCLGCMGVGHDQDTCRSEPLCRVCIERTGERCSRCGGVGHTEHVCSTLVCEWCGDLGHAKALCTLWQHGTRRWKLPGRTLEQLGFWVKSNTGGRAGLLVSMVAPGSPAERAGLRVGAVLVACNGAAVSDPTMFGRAAQHCALTGRHLELFGTPSEEELEVAGHAQVVRAAALKRGVAENLQSHGDGGDTRGLTTHNPTVHRPKPKPGGSGDLYRNLVDPITGAVVSGFENQPRSKFRPQIVAGVRPGRNVHPGDGRKAQPLKRGDRGKTNPLLDLKETMPH